VDTSRDSRRVADMRMLQTTLQSGWRGISCTFRSEAISALAKKIMQFLSDR
jgi:hypothetical protein